MNLFSRTWFKILKSKQKELLNDFQPLYADHFINVWGIAYTFANGSDFCILGFKIYIPMMWPMILMSLWKMLYECNGDIAQKFKNSRKKANRHVFKVDQKVNSKNKLRLC